MSNRSSSRGGLLKVSGAVAVSSTLGTLLGACGFDERATMTSSDQLALTATQAVEAIRTA